MPPNVEAVAARPPHLAVLYRSGPNVTAAEQLERLGIKTVLLDLNRLEELGPAARRLGVLTGRVASADSLARAMDSLAAAPPQPLTPGPQSLVFIVWDNPPIVIGAGSNLDRLPLAARGRHAVPRNPPPPSPASIRPIAAPGPQFRLRRSGLDLR